MSVPDKAILTCSSVASLESDIHRFQKEFPERSKKRNHERLLLYRYLRKRAPHLAFPIRIFHSDKPDFVLKTADEVAGLEAVLLTTGSLEKGRFLADTKFRSYSIDLTQLCVTDEITRNDAIEAMLGEPAIPTAVPVAELESKWRERLQLLLAGKAQKMTGYGHDIVDLLIGDQLSFGDFESFDRVRRYLADFSPAFASAKNLRIVMVAGLNDSILIQKKPTHEAPD